MKREPVVPPLPLQPRKRSQLQTLSATTPDAMTDASKPLAKPSRRSFSRTPPYRLRHPAQLRDWRISPKFRARAQNIVVAL